MRWPWSKRRPPLTPRPPAPPHFQAGSPQTLYTHADFQAYRAWAAQQVCQGCGRPASEAREEPWVTETECWRCHFGTPYHIPREEPDGPQER